MLEKRISNGKVYTNLSNLHVWEENPRKLDQEDFERLKRQVANLGQYKPLLVTEDGTIIGGNMRFLAFQELGFQDVWITELGFAQVELPVGETGSPTKWKAVIDGKLQDKEYESRDQIMIEYALSDNDQAGYYDETALAQLIHPYQTKIEAGTYKLDLGKPVDMKQFLDQFQPVNGNGDETEEDEKSKEIVISIKFTPDQYNEIAPKIDEVKAKLETENMTDLFVRLLNGATFAEVPGEVDNVPSDNLQTNGTGEMPVNDQPQGTVTIEEGSTVETPASNQEPASTDSQESESTASSDEMGVLTEDATETPGDNQTPVVDDSQQDSTQTMDGSTEQPTDTASTPQEGESTNETPATPTQ